MQLFQLLIPLLLLPQKLQQLLLLVLLQQLLELLSLLLPHLFFFFLFPSLALFFFPPPLLDGVKPDGPRHLFRDMRGLNLFIHGTGILRQPITAGSIANGDGIPHTPQTWEARGLPSALEGEASRPASVTAGRCQKHSPPPTDEAGFSQHSSMAEDRRNLCALKDDTSVAKKLDARITQLQYY